MAAVRTDSPPPAFFASGLRETESSPLRAYRPLMTWVMQTVYAADAQNRENVPSIDNQKVGRMKATSQRLLIEQQAASLRRVMETV